MLWGPSPQRAIAQLPILMQTFLPVFIFNSCKRIALVLQLLASTPLHFSSQYTSALCSSSFSFHWYGALTCYRIRVTGFLFPFPSSCVVLCNFIMFLPLPLPAQSLSSADPNSDHLKQSQYRRLLSEANLPPSWMVKLHPLNKKPSLKRAVISVIPPNSDFHLSL